MRITITLDRDDDLHLVPSAVAVVAELTPSCGDRRHVTFEGYDNTKVFIDRTKAGWSVHLRYQPMEGEE
jgi:hypothetical protein